MPKSAEYTVAWSKHKNGYFLLYDAVSYPIEDNAMLSLKLIHVRSFRFCSATGETMTVRKEQKQRGSGYWYAYKRVGGKIQKKYLGERHTITFEVLENTIQTFTQPKEPPPPPREGQFMVAWSMAKNCYLFHFNGCSTGYELSTDTMLRNFIQHIDLFLFRSRTGETMEVRKKQKGNEFYWYASKQGHLQEKFLSETLFITFAFLEHTLASFTEPKKPPQQDAPKPPPQQDTPPTQPVLTFKNNLESALRIFHFASLADMPDKKALLPRYRDLSKQHHPDKGGVHENMVAVNLAFDYLKKFLD